MLKIRSGLGKTAVDRVVGSGFRAPDELGMTFAGTLKPATSRFCHGIVSESLLKQHHESQFSEIDRLVYRSFSLRPAAPPRVILVVQEPEPKTMSIRAQSLEI